jgi:molybdopterin synthase catalytic subunit
MAFDPLDRAAAYQRERRRAGADGACALFIGTVRDRHAGQTVTAMTLEHYPGMTEAEIQRSLAEAAGRWAMDDALILHRVGRLLPGDPIVLVAVWATHRGAACDACRYCLEALKSRAPFWKKEELADGTSRWVAGNTPPWAP